MDASWRLLAPWLRGSCRFQQQFFNRARVGRDPWDLRKGHPFKRAFVPFGECVLHLPARKNPSQLTSGLRHGFFVGVADGGDEVFIGTEAQVVKSRSFQRLPEGAKSEHRLASSISSDGQSGSPICFDKNVRAA